MNKIQIFENTEFGQVRVVEIDGTPWFVGKDIADALGYSNPRDALARHVDDEDKTDVGIHDGSQTRQMTIINESGLYALIFSSKLPAAKRFKQWITAEVIPVIRSRNHVVETPALACNTSEITQSMVPGVQFFSYEDTPVRIIMIDNEPWWVLADVCKVLGIKNSRDVVSRLNEDEKGVGQIYTPGGKQNVTIINEPGLYRVVLRSDKPSAEPFMRWITHDVVPSIRKHGAYMTQNVIQQIIASPDYGIQLLLQLKREQEEKQALMVENEVLRPKGDYFDDLVARDTLTGFRETAKELGVPPKKFVIFLLDHKYVYRDQRGKLMPYEEKNNGLFEVKECRSEKTAWSGTQTMITPKGRATFRRLYCEVQGKELHTVVAFHYR